MVFHKINLKYQKKFQVDTSNRVLLIYRLLVQNKEIKVIHSPTEGITFNLYILYINISQDFFLSSGLSLVKKKIMSF